MSTPDLAILSVHTSPLAMPGAGDGGGMNVYVRALATALARAGVTCDVLTRAEDEAQAPIVEVEPGFRVLHVEAGPRHPISKHALVETTDEFTGRVAELVAQGTINPHVLHANYWLSGIVGHTLKHELDVPLVATFHTLARVKADAGVDDDPVMRTRVEHDIVDCADVMLASTAEEGRQLNELYGADPDRIEIVPPGVEHSLFSPGSKADARARLGFDGGRVLLFAGRIQPLKGVELAVGALECLDDPAATLVIVGGPSGPEGDLTVERLRQLVADQGLERQVRFVPPRPHDALADYYRAADVCIVPSHTESFGLVALEAAACGTPVVAAAVGGLRSLVVDGETGFLVEGREPCHYSDPVERLMNDPDLAAELGRHAWARSWRYSWNMTAARLRRLYSDLATREPLRCA